MSIDSTVIKLINFSIPRSFAWKYKCIIENMYTVCYTWSWEK